MAKLGMKEGFDIGLEMSGAPMAFDQMVDSMITGGKLAMLGLPAGKSEVDWARVIFKSLTIKGIYGREMFETWYKMIAMLQSGLDVRGVITHRMKAEEYGRAFELMKQGSAGKIVLDWT
jgi:threonine 3-dehydrogenase